MGLGEGGTGEEIFRGVRERMHLARGFEDGGEDAGDGGVGDGYGDGSVEGLGTRYDGSGWFERLARAWVGDG